MENGQVVLLAAFSYSKNKFGFIYLTCRTSLVNKNFLHSFAIRLEIRILIIQRGLDHHVLFG